MKTFRTSLNLFAASAIVFAAFGAAPALANTAAQVDSKVKGVVAPTPTKAVTKAKASRTKLPRRWVWKKYAKNFDSMFRR